MATATWPLENGQKTTNKKHPRSFSHFFACFRLFLTIQSRILRFFLRLELGQIFSTLGRFLTKLHSQPGEKGHKSTGENPVEMAPRNCRFLSLVAVNPVLMLIFELFELSVSDRFGPSVFALFHLLPCSGCHLDPPEMCNSKHPNGSVPWALRTMSRTT